MPKLESFIKAAMSASADANTASTSADAVNVVYTPRTSWMQTFLSPLQKTLADVKVETTGEATNAVETLNKALEEVSTAQAKLGAIQNRLTHNIDLKGSC